MKRLLILLALAPLVLVGQAHAQSREIPGPNYNVYYANHTDWPVERAAAKWSRSPWIDLVKVPDCTGYDPCATVVAKPRTDYPGLDPERVAGLTIWTQAFDRGPVKIELYEFVTNQYDRDRIACHELGHYVLQTNEHPHAGCLGPNEWKSGPGKYLRTRIPVFRGYIPALGATRH